MFHAKRFSSVRPRKGGPYGLYCYNCDVWVPNTAPVEADGMGFAYSHSCRRKSPKFLVLKIDDVDDLPDGYKEMLGLVMAKIYDNRESKGKWAENFYWVVNRDESYATKVRDLIFDNESNDVDPEDFNTRVNSD